jgi:cbb3-type cytochrome oxidase maturation protein
VEILYLLILISMLMALLGLGAFLWANASGQFGDLKKPAEEILIDDNDHGDRT